MASKEPLVRLVAGAALCAAALAVSSIRCDASKKPLQTWGVDVLRAKTPYRVRSTTTLGGSKPLGNAQMVPIASGEFQNWQWAVKAYPTLLPSLEAWQTYGKVRKWMKTPDSWSHPAPDWQQGFERTYKVVAYLLGRKPLPLRATILLLPEDTSYHKTFTQQAVNHAPMTFAFHYPDSSSSSRHAQSERLAALVEPFLYMVGEYEQVVLATDPAGKALGRSRADRIFGNVALGICWSQSDSLALLAGDHEHMNFNVRVMLPNGASSGAQVGPGAQTGGSKAPEPDASHGAERLRSYLRDVGFPKQKVSTRDPEAMNRVLNFCRAMTAYYLDLAEDRRPPSRAQFNSFFPPSGR
jgi:hypothetical protein